MPQRTVAVTGGNGTVGRAALAEFGANGYRTANLNRGKPDARVADEYRTTDLTDAGEVYGSLAAAEPDVIVHLGMIPTPERHPEHVVFESNAVSTYTVLSAAQALGVEQVVLASSLSALGAGFEPDPLDPEYLPLDESHPLTPSTAYGIGKRALETVADGFGRRDRPPRTVASLRFPWVTDEATQREAFVEPDRSLEGLRTTGDLRGAHDLLFSYLDLEDAARAVRLAAEAGFEGHEACFLSAADSTAETPTRELVEARYPAAERRGELEGNGALIDTGKAKRLLGWEPRRSWRDLR
jgi:nucleoside-diphosphate-sugar epimerase